MQITSIVIDLRKNKSVKSARCFSFNHFYCNPNGIEKNTDHYEFSPVRRSNKNRSLNFMLLACNVSLLSEDGRGMHLVTPKQAPKITNSIRWINTSHYAVSHIFAPNIFGHWLESLSENHTKKTSLEVGSYSKSWFRMKWKTKQIGERYMMDWFVNRLWISFNQNIGRHNRFSSVTFSSKRWEV